LLRRQNLIREAKACFEKAYQTAAAAKELALAADAAHMLAMMLPFDEARIWNDHGLAMAEASSDPMLRHWVGVLANNWGWRLDEQGDHAGAALSFARALACRRVEGDESLIRASEFALAVELRQLGMAEQALAIQQRLQQEATAAKEPVGEIVIERIHNLWTLKRNDEAREVATEALSPPIQKSLSTVQIEKIRTQLQALSGQSSH
jgi:tetratricopeptide (TPR) repeat protein